MRYTKLLFINCLVLFCNFNASGVVRKNAIIRDIKEYKAMTEYLIANNYAKGFKAYEVYYKANLTDTTILNFLTRYHIMTISINHSKDSTITYNHFSIPIIGKRRKLIFDFSSFPQTESYKKNGIRWTIIEKSIYYVEY